jgi:hypothetical protein
MRNAWVAVACADHVQRGRKGGFMQVCHGKAAPLGRISPSDGIVYYSPRKVFKCSEPCRSFTAAGIVSDGAPYQVDMGDGFQPWRRDVRWTDTKQVPIAPLLSELSFTSGKANWGYQFRFGLLMITCSEFELILSSMTGGESAGDRDLGVDLSVW